MIVLCWDIDGTLLTTGRAGIHAWEGAAQEVLGRKYDMEGFKTDGMTDMEIGRAIFDQLGIACSPGLLGDLVFAYGKLLPEVLPLRKGRVMPRVVEILEGSRRRPDILNVLLTGNTSAGASAKLEYYGLDRYFNEGAFSNPAVSRAEIAENARVLALRLATGSGALHAVFVIGDTPADILCSRVIEARAIAVATGAFGVQELQACNPWWVVPMLPTAQVFFEKITAQEAVKTRLSRH